MNTSDLSNRIMKNLVIFLVLIGIVSCVIPQVYAQTDDDSIVFFSLSGEKNSDPDLLNFGSIHWMERTYYATESVAVKVIDPDMNLNSHEIDIFDVAVWSKSDDQGITLAVAETGIATGVFKGTVFFTTDEESSGDRLRVAEGDWVVAKYVDKTLPSSYTRANSLDVTNTSRIKVTQPPPLKQYESGMSLERIQCNGEMVLVQKENSDNGPACIKFESISKLIERGWIQENSLFDTRISVEDVMMQYDKSSSVVTISVSLDVSNPNSVAVVLDNVQIVFALHDIHLKHEMFDRELGIPAYSSKTLDTSFDLILDKNISPSIISVITDGGPGILSHGTAHFDSENGLLQVPFDIFGKEFQGT